MTDNFKKTYNSLLDKFQKEYGKDIFNKTLKYQKQYGFEIGTGEHAMWNNEADAFKHTFMQADLTRRFGAAAAKYFGDRHERQGNQSMGQAKGEENMDRWNNQAGREIAQEIKEEYLKNMSKTNLFQKHDINWDDLIAKKNYGTDENR